MAPLNSDLLPALQKIEVSSSFQIPSFQVVGLPGPEVQEAKERIRSAILASGFEFPKRRVVVNLWPSSVRKRGTGADLSMALAVLFSESDGPKVNFSAWGELGLDGTVKSVGQITRAIYGAWQEGVPYLLVPDSEVETAFRQLEFISQRKQFSSKPPDLIGVPNLWTAWKWAKNPTSAPGPSPVSCEKTIALPNDLMPLQPALKRAVFLSVCGDHHILLLGPRGSGKTHALRWIEELTTGADGEANLTQVLLAELNTTSHYEVPVIRRRVGVHTRPTALIGSTTAFGLRPGEFSLAHGGVLIADELPEWPRDSREALREPLESGYVTLTRNQGNFRLPARFQFAATGNLCPCGGWPVDLMKGLLEGKSRLKCRCTPRDLALYLSRLSGPILDRIDILQLVGPPSEFPPLLSAPLQSALEEFKELRSQLENLRRLLLSMWGQLPGKLGGAEVESILSSLVFKPKKLEKLCSLRERHKQVRLALTLAAMRHKTNNSPQPTAEDFHEALRYRSVFQQFQEPLEDRH